MNEKPLKRASRKSAGKKKPPTKARTRRTTKVVSTATTSRAKPKLRSGFEKKVRESLQAYKVDFSYESEKLPFTVPVQSRSYLPDFVVTTRSGKKIYIEAKGKLDSDARKKMKLVLEQHPDKDIRILFMRDQPIRKGSRTFYSDWARKVGIPYHTASSGHVPEEWIEE